MRSRSDSGQAVGPWLISRRIHRMPGFATRPRYCCAGAVSICRCWRSSRSSTALRAGARLHPQRRLCPVLPRRCGLCLCPGRGRRSGAAHAAAARRVDRDLRVRRGGAEFPPQTASQAPRRAHTGVHGRRRGANALGLNRDIGLLRQKVEPPVQIRPRGDQRNRLAAHPLLCQPRQCQPPRALASASARCRSALKSGVYSVVQRKSGK